MSATILLKRLSVFRAVLGSQPNRGKGTELSRPPHPDRLPHDQHPHQGDGAAMTDDLH